jgi:protein-S-isoprenylcysteine O-methyltransferase Ste14
MTRVSASLGSVIFFFCRSRRDAGVVPWWMTRWQVRSSLPDVLLLKIVGVVWYEEPTLRKTFGPEYDSYCANVPR